MSNTIIHPSNIQKGKIFPISIIKLLKEFKPDKKLKLYQQYISTLMLMNSKFQNILIYHDLGTGKTITAINIINSFDINYIKIILLPASLKDSNWVKALQKWTKMNNIFFVSFNSPNFYDKLIEIKNSNDNNMPIMYIIDEAHNFFHNVLSNIDKNEGSKNALNVYNNINNDLQHNDSNKLIVLSATPILNHPFELALLYNLLRPNTFPTQKSEFENLFMNENFDKNKNIFIKRILGLTSFYLNNDKENFPSVNKKIIKVPMSKYQYNIYSFYNEKEKKNQSSYKIYTRSASNFVFPDKMNPFQRPRPNMFKNKKDYDKAILQYKNNLINYFKKNISADEIKKDFNLCIKSYKQNLYYFIFHYKQISKSLKNLYDLSSKMTSILFYLFKNKKQKNIIYSSFTSLEGIEIMSLYLNIINIKYLYYSGNLNLQERAKNVEKFNDKNNIYGEKYQVFLLSSAGIEGISLTNVRSVHILEPSWNQGIIKQLIGRAVRLNSHQDLNKNDRNVQVFFYITFVKKDIDLTDQIIYKNSLESEKIKNKFLNLLKISAFDCELLKNQNQKNQKYDCFHFNQNTYIQHFNNINIGPAFQKDFQKSKNNGLFSKNTEIKEIKIYLHKISYQNKTIHAYIDFNTGLVYDKHYNNIPIGILETDNKNLFKINKQQNDVLFIMKNS